jgi:predicted CoA-substrate-specific enzyme activase
LTAADAGSNPADMSERSAKGEPRLGIDIGSVNLHVHAEAGDGRTQSWVRPLQGRPLEVLAGLVGGEVLEFLGDRPVRLGVTGQARDLLDSAVEAVRVNEVVAAAAAARALLPETRTVIELGGHLSKWILLDDDGGIADFATNGLCAAGSGAFLDQQASRLRISVEEFGRIATDASSGATVAGRCSVFAKSDMIHLQQKGAPTEEIAYGVCQALARTFAATVLEGRELEPPVVLAGGVGTNPGVLRALVETSGLARDAFHTPTDPKALCAVGAALLAASSPPVSLRGLAEIDAAGLRRRRGQSAHTLPRLSEVHVSEEPSSPIPAQGRVEAYLGIDVGSVSTNLALTSSGGDLLTGVYLRTRGKPVEVLAEGLAELASRFGDRLRVLGVGATGSGRHLAAQLLGADVVRNEITAQLVSATRYVPEVDTVLEIGGQDSKYIGTRGGHLSGFEMNKICAAGTGSFLEEQADGLGISIFDEFAALAFESDTPRDLGSKCTVFMEAELRRAQQEGTPLPDICSGLAYSVARNYLEKVVAGREIGQTVVFQGGTASNAAVVAAFSSLLGRPVQVHPHNRISGAIGMALIAAREREQLGYETAFRGLAACEGHSTKSFECKKCENRCRVSRIRVGERRVHFGDACERYAEKDARAPVHERPFPELFAERGRLLQEELERARQVSGAGAKGALGLTRASLGYELAPLFSSLVAHLGYRPELSGRTTQALVDRGSRGLPAELCLPIKVAAGHVASLLAQAPERPVLVPSIVDMLAPRASEESATCHFTQEWPAMLPRDLAGRVIRPQLGLGGGAAGLLQAARALARSLDESLPATALALKRALDAQERFTLERRELGRAALESDFDRAVVVIGRPYNLHDPFCNLDLAKYLDRVGLPAIPLDMLPVDEVELDERWDSVPWQFGRAALRAVELIRRDRRLFPVVTSSFGCGVDGFVLKHIEELLADRPRLLLEFDEHRAEAGLVTRLEAFSDEIEDHLRAVSGARPARSTPGTDWSAVEGRIFVPDLEEFTHAFTGALRGAGFDAVALPRPTAETLVRGEAFSSGRECHPYTVIGGQLVELIESGEPREGDVFFSPSSFVPCLIRQYGDNYRLIQERIGDSSLRIFDLPVPALDHFVGLDGLLCFFEGLAALELLMPLARRVRPYADEPDAPLDRLAIAAVEIEQALANKDPIKPVLAAASAEILDMAVNGRPGDLPVVGVTGDLYTRFHAAGNAGLFDTLEQLGNEVWFSPYFAASTQLSDRHETPHILARGNIKKAAWRKLSETTSSALYRAMVKAMPAEAAKLVSEPSADDILELARPYCGPLSSWLVVLSVGKMIDFLSRGASGAITAAGVNCMVGAAIAGQLPAIRQDQELAPMISLVYGGSEGPAHRIRLETFSQQVHDHSRGRVRA